MHRQRAGVSSIIRPPSARVICLCFISIAFSCSSYKYSKDLEFQVQEDHLHSSLLHTQENMLPQALGLMAPLVIGLVSAQEALLPCGNAFYVESQVRLSPKSFDSKLLLTMRVSVVHMLRWQQALPRRQWSANRTLRPGLLPLEHVLVCNPNPSRILFRLAFRLILFS